VSLLWAAYRLAAPCLGVVAPAAGVFASPLERPLWRERMGEVTATGGVDAWVHAASLGEASAVPPLLRELDRARAGASFWLTATSRTGRSRLAECGLPTSLAPIDSPQATRRFLSGVRPKRIFLVETELWPHWLLRARRLGVPVAVVSARLSERSVERYRRLGGGLRALVAGLGAVLCQGEADERRWLALGAPRARTRVVGNLKSDGLPHAAADRDAARRALGLDPARPLLVLASLRPGEPHALARAWGGLPAALRERWQVVAVPRHPAASSSLREEAGAAGATLAAEGEVAPGAWRWDGRAGVLGSWYAVADAAFVGGSLVPIGGHNPLEPAACGAAVLMGPHHATQRDAVRALESGGGIVIAAGGEPLTAALASLLGDDARRAVVARAGLEVAKAQRGAAARAVEQLVALGLWPA